MGLRVQDSNLRQCVQRSYSTMLPEKHSFLVAVINIMGLSLGLSYLALLSISVIITQRRQGM